MSSTSRATCVSGCRWPRRTGVPGRVTSSVSSSCFSCRRVMRRAASRSASSSRTRKALSARPVSRSRTSLRAWGSAARRPRYETCTSDSSSLVFAAEKASRAARSYSSQSTAATVTDRFSISPPSTSSRGNVCNAPARLEERAAARALAPVPGEPGRAKGEARGRHCHPETIATVSSPYDAIAELYDPGSASVVEDVDFYLEEARRSGGPLLELGIGTGRIAVPIAADGIRVIGIDSSRAMLDICARRAALAGVQVDLRVGDLRHPPVVEQVPLVICPFRSLLHMHTDDDRREALASVRNLLHPGGRFGFDGVRPGAEDIAQPH